MGLFELNGDNLEIKLDKDTKYTTPSLTPPYFSICGKGLAKTWVIAASSSAKTASSNRITLQQVPWFPFSSNLFLPVFN